MQLPPLDLGDAELLADLVGFFAGAVIVQGAGPAAHVEGEMLGQTRLVADIFEQIFQPPRRPGEDLLGGVVPLSLCGVLPVLAKIFLVGRDPIIGQGQLSLFVAVRGAGITNKDLRPVRCFQVDMFEL